MKAGRLPKGCLQLKGCKNVASVNYHKYYEK